MTFPDPWPKKKHHKNRLFKKEFVDLFYEKLSANGLFIFITDFKDYFDESFELISNDMRFDLIKDLNEYEPDLKIPCSVKNGKRITGIFILSALLKNRNKGAQAPLPQYFL